MHLMSDESGLLPAGPIAAEIPARDEHYFPLPHFIEEFAAVSAYFAHNELENVVGG